MVMMVMMVMMGMKTMIVEEKRVREMAVDENIIIKANHQW